MSTGARALQKSLTDFSISPIILLAQQNQTYSLPYRSPDMNYKKLKRRLGKLSSSRNFASIKDQYAELYKIRLKDKEDIAGIRKAGRLTVDILDLVEEHIRPGITTNEVNSIVEEFTRKNNARSAPLHYHGFPKSVCTSVNNVVCHGIPDDTALKEGDIVNVDVTPVLDGYFADASRTFFVGSAGKDAQKIVCVAKECLRLGVLQVKPGNTIGDIGYAIQRYAESEGCSVVREYVGHGVGFEFHEPPQVPHFGQKGHGIPLVPGMVFTIEPMINLGKHNLHVLSDNWTAVTDDGSLSAQFEQTVLLTDSGVEILTPFD
jgi:methionyl aminopeptidase